MAEYFTFHKILQVGGPTIVVLIIAFVAVAVLIVERIIFFARNSVDSESILLTISEKIHSGGLSGARDFLSKDVRYEAQILLECMESQIKLVQFDNNEYEEAKSRKIASFVPSMERYTGTFATLAGVSPFIGLLGTVLGIIRAFVSLGSAATGAGPSGLSGLNAGIAEALVTTAAGLIVAIPSTVAYNAVRLHVNRTLLQMEISASRLKQMIKKSLSA